MQGAEVVKNDKMLFLTSIRVELGWNRLDFRHVAAV